MHTFELPGLVHPQQKVKPHCNKNPNSRWSRSSKESNMEILAIWAAMAVVGYYIGNAKGRGPFGAVLGFLLGPLGWLLMLVMSENPDAVHKCPECLSRVPIEARKCARCGSSLVDEDKLHIRSLLQPGNISSSRPTQNHQTTLRKPLPIIESPVPSSEPSFVPCPYCSIPLNITTPGRYACPKCNGIIEAS